MCLEQCHKDSDCRQSEGYVCADPRQPPWNGVIVDDDQAQLVCIQLPDYKDGGGYSTNADAAVCQATGPTVPEIDAGPVVLGTGSGGGGVDASGN
jgi:predicted oxidoreductase